MKFCKDCKWIKYGHEYIWCESPNNGINLVEGTVATQRCYVLRTNTGQCGPAAKWFEEKPKKKFWFF